MDGAAQILHRVLDDGQSQTGAAAGSGMALVHPVEPLEHPALMLRRDADAGVGHGQRRAVGGRGEVHGDAAVGNVVLDGVVAKVIEDLGQQTPHAADGDSLAGDGESHVFGGSRVVKGGDGLLRQRPQRHAFGGQLHALVQLGQADDILDQRHQPRGLAADAAYEHRHILRLYQTIFHQLGAAHDGLQRGFQLVGHIGGELPAVALGQRLLRHVEGQHHRAGNVALGADAADVQLVLPAVPLRVDLAVALRHGGLQRVAHLSAALDGQEVLPQTGGVGVEQAAGRGVDAEDHTRFVQQHKALLHAAGDLLKFVLLAPQLLYLRVDLAALLVDAAQQGRQLLIGVVVQRVLQIQLIQGLYDMLGQTPRQQRRQGQRHHQHHKEGLEHAQHQHACRGAADGDTQHRAVVEPLGLIERFFQQRGRVAAALAVSGQQRLLDLLSLAVVFHSTGIGLRVVQHRAVRCHPRQTIAVRAEGGEIALAVQPLYGGRGKAQLVLQLLLLHAAEVFV